jgi:hypothetical protein
MDQHIPATAFSKFRRVLGEMNAERPLRIDLFYLANFAETLHLLDTKLDTNTVWADEIAHVVKAWGDHESETWVGGFVVDLKDGRRMYVESRADGLEWGPESSVSIVPVDAGDTLPKLPEDHVSERYGWAESPSELDDYLARLADLSRAETPEWLKGAVLPRDQFPSGVNQGEFVPLTMEEFRHAYATFLDVLDGRRTADPNFPTVVQDAKTGEARQLEDTPFNRAWITAGKEFADEARRLSFYWRVEHVMPIAVNEKYAKYRDRRAGSMHIALLSAVARVPVSYRTTKKPLRAAFDAQFHRHLAVVVGPASEMLNG